MAHECSSPAEIEDAPGDAASAACGAGSSKPSPAMSEIRTAGISRRRRTARPALVAPADMACPDPPGAGVRVAGYYSQLQPATQSDGPTRAGRDVDTGPGRHEDASTL